AAAPMKDPAAPAAAAPGAELAFHGRLKGLMMQTVILAKTHPGVSDDLNLLFTEAQGLGRHQLYAQGQELLDKAERRIKQAMTGTAPPRDPAAALKAWQTARAEVLAQLTRLEGAVAACGHPDAAKA